MILDKATREKYSAWVSDTFRQSADEYYIAARSLYRAQLDGPFLWCALQSVEKYLKAILLFQLESVKKDGHDATALLNRVRQLKLLRFETRGPVDEFVEHLTVFGADRYLEHTRHNEGRELFELDHTVWQVRRYCRDFLLMPGDDSRYSDDERSRRLSETWNADFSRPTDFQLEGGWLERVLGGPRSAARAALVWKNPCFGLVQRRTLSRYPGRFGWRKPLHIMFPELLPLLERLVFFRKDVLAALKEKLNVVAGSPGQPDQVTAADAAPPRC